MALLAKLSVTRLCISTPFQDEIRWACLIMVSDLSARCPSTSTYQRDSIAQHPCTSPDLRSLFGKQMSSRVSSALSSNRSGQAAISLSSGIDYQPKAHNMRTLLVSGRISTSYYLPDPALSMFFSLCQNALFCLRLSSKVERLVAFVRLRAFV